MKKLNRLLASEALMRWLRLGQRFKRSYLNDGLSWSRKLSQNKMAISLDVPRVLVATSVAGHLTALNFESVIAKSLAVRGASVTALLCDQALPACMDCEHRFYPTATARQKLVDRGPKELCISCTRVGKNIYGQAPQRSRGGSRSVTFPPEDGWSSPSEKNSSSGSSGGSASTFGAASMAQS